MARSYPISWGSDDDVVLIDQEDVSNYNDDNILPEPPEMIAQIRAWLQPTEHSIDSSEYNKHLAAHLEGTGGWIPLQEKYKQWHDGDEHGLLWIKGIPGSGKSVHAANLIHNLSKEGVPVLFFFFRQIIDANHKPINLLRDWLDQILLFSPPLQALLKDYVEKGRSLDSVAPSDFWRLLRVALAYLPKVYCVADALDEMDNDNDTFIQALAELGSWRPSRVKVLMTSRPVASAEAPMRGIQVIDIRLEEQLVDVDIATYVRYSLEHSHIPASDQDQIKKAVPGRANGLFLYAKLAMNAFLQPGADVQGVLNKVPLNLDDMYTGILQEHARRSGVSAETQLLILKWVTHAIRPLRLLELGDMVRSAMAAQDRMSPKESKAYVRGACGPLLEILPDETVSVVHHSLTEFLIGVSRTAESTGFPILDFGRTHAQLASACLDYMLSGCFEAFLASPDVHNYTTTWPQALVLDFPFSAYAIDNWYLHASKTEWTGSSGKLLTQRLDAFLADEPVKTSWIRVAWQLFDDRPGVEDITTIHLSACCGLPEYTLTLLDRGGNDLVDCRGSFNRTPLWCAAMRGHEEVLKVLVRAGADPNASDETGARPIHRAAKLNHFKAVKFLLELGVDPLSTKRSGDELDLNYDPSEDDDNPMADACRYGHVETTEAFLPYLDLDSKHRALHWSTVSQNSRLVERILQEDDIDPNRRVRGCTPLFLSAKRGDVKSMEVLVRYGADASCVCGDGRLIHYNYSPVPRTGFGSTALSEFSNLPAHRLEPEEFHRGMSLLIQAGAQVNQREPGGYTALHRARTPIMAKLLLEAGADPGAETDAGQTPLHFACCFSESVNAVIELGYVGINKKDRRWGMTPLHVAIRYNIKLACELLEHSPDCNIADHGGNGPLHIAMSTQPAQSWNTWFCEELASKLLKAGADVNMRNANGETPLHILATGCHAVSDSLIRLLVESGADINARDSLGRTPLFRLTGDRSGTDGFLTRLETFTSLSADLNTRDREGRTLLHAAIHAFVSGTGVPRNRLEAYRCLLNTGISPLLVDYKGNTLCHEAAKAGSEFPKLNGFAMAEVVRELAAVGVDANQPNYGGVTPLHIMCQAVPDSVYDMSFLWPLKDSKVIDLEDYSGMRPIHYAASASEEATAQLLSAGADPFAMTWERSNALHIAARYGYSNMIGNILDSMKRSNPSAVKQAVNLADISSHTPLHYAARTGRPESVALLLDAGADPNPPRNNNLRHLGSCVPQHTVAVRTGCHSKGGLAPPVTWLPPVLQCALLGELQQTSQASTTFFPSPNEPGTRGHRQRAGRNRGILEDIKRFDEVIELLVSAGAKPSEDEISKAIDCATDYRDDYIVSLLLKLRKELYGIECSASLSPEASLSLARRESETRRLREIGRAISIETKDEAVLHLAAEHRYSMVKECYEEGVDFKSPCTPCGSLLAQLVRSGLADLVDSCCSPADVELFENEEWLDKYEEESLKLGGRWSTPLEFPSLLHFACQRRLPNMDVVRVLVEKKAVTMNRPLNPRGYSSNTTLHYLARGEQWWHVFLAIPYLVSKGAEVDIRSSIKNHTPLQEALSMASLLSNENSFFGKDAVEMLIKLGADVNATDSKGENCLSWAGDDEELIRLLIGHGAVVTPSAIHNAVGKLNVGALEVLLSAKDSANLASLWSKTSEDVPDNEGSSSTCYESVDSHPLVLASTFDPDTPITRILEDASDHSNRLRIMKVLLAAGASPYDTFIKDDLKRCPMERAADHPSVRAWNTWRWDQPEAPSPRERTWYGLGTVFHEILMNSQFYEPILEIPDLDLEYRDTRGLTPLLASCHRAQEPVPFRANEANQALGKLLERGANPMAVDDQGRNVFHHLLGSWWNPEAKVASLKDLRHVMAELINRPDSFGFYPLHYGLAVDVSANKDGKIPAWLDFVLSEGADPRVVDGEGNNALHYLSLGVSALALDSKHKHDIVSRFIQLGLDVNARNNAGASLLHLWGLWVSFHDHCCRDLLVLGIEFLDKIGIDWKARDNEGKTILHAAARARPDRHGVGQCPDMFQAGVDRGVDPLLEDVNGCSSLDVAAAYGNELVLDLFGPKDGKEKKEKSDGRGQSGKRSHWPVMRPPRLGW